MSTQDPAASIARDATASHGRLFSCVTGTRLTRVAIPGRSESWFAQPSCRSRLAWLFPALLVVILAGCYPPAAPVAVTLEDSAADPVLSEARLAWSRELGGAINWAPRMLESTSGPLLIIAAAPDTIVALDPASGQEVWRYQPAKRLWSDSVAVVDDGVFVGSEGGQVQILDGTTGKARWQVSLQPADDEVQAGLEARGQPAWTGDTLYVPTAGVGSRAITVNPALRAPLVALNLATGEERWRVETDNYILRVPFVDGESQTVYVGGARLSDVEIDEGGAQRIYALSSEDGEVKWTYDSLDGLTKSIWAGSETVVFAAYQDFLAGIDSRSGQEVWRENSGNWVQSFAPLSLEGTSAKPAIAYGSANGFLNLVDPVDGSDVWRFDLPGTFNYPMGNAVQSEGAVYFITQQGDLYALDAASGNLLWMVPTGLESRDGVAVDAGRLFVGDAGGTVYAFDLP